MQKNKEEGHKERFTSLYYSKVTFLFSSDTISPYIISNNNQLLKTR